MTPSLHLCAGHDDCHGFFFEFFILAQHPDTVLRYLTDLSYRDGYSEAKRSDCSVW